MPAVTYERTANVIAADPTLTADPGSGGTTLTVTSTAAFPTTAGRFRLRVDDEIMLATSPPTDSTHVVVARGQEGTTAVAHSVGSSARVVLSSGALANLLAQQTTFISVQDPAYGAKGDAPYSGAVSGTDDTTAIQNAINAVAALSTDGTVWFPPGSYRVSGGLTGADGVTLLGAGPEVSMIRADDVSTALITVNGSAATADNLTANLNRFTRVVTLGANGTNYPVGTYVFIRDSLQSTYAGGTDVSPFWLTRIGSQNGNTLITEEKAPSNYTTAQTARIQKVTYLRDFKIQNLSFQVAGTIGSTANRSTAITANWARDFEITGCKFENFQSGGSGNPIWLNQCYAAKVHDCFFEHCLDVPGATVANTRCIDCYGCNKTKIYDCIFRRVSGAMNHQNSPWTQVTDCVGSGGSVPLVLVPTVNTPTTSAGGGVWGSTGTKFYRVTAVNAYGETTASTEVSVAVGTATLTVNLVINNLFPNAEQYKIYRSNTSGVYTTPALVATVQSTATSFGTTTYADTGTATTSGTFPAFSTTGASDDTLGNRGYKMFSGNDFSLIADCICHDFDDTGIYVYDSAYCIVSGCSVLGARDNGIHLGASDAQVGAYGHHNKLVDCTVRGIWGGSNSNLGGGIGLQLEGRYHDVTHNTVSDCGVAGAACQTIQDCSVTHNTFTDITPYFDKAITMFTGPSNVNNTIAFNRAYGTNPNIDTSGGGGNYVYDNIGTVTINTSLDMVPMGRAPALGAPTGTVASATTTTLPVTARFVTVSGTTTITSVTASWKGRVVTLQFSGALTFTDGSNLKLAGNFVTTADDTITLVCDGTNWSEMCRAVN